jgi:two-component system chemotaxis response regulator CheY
MRILIVDDSKTMQLLIEKTLKEIGYNDLLICDSAKSALGILQNEKPDLILLDWHMPEMNGLEFLKKLKSDNELKSIPVILLTVEDETENVSKAIESGAEGYILKPINKELLLTRLKDIEANNTLGLKK